MFDTNVAVITVFVNVDNCMVVYIPLPVYFEFLKRFLCLFFIWGFKIFIWDFKKISVGELREYKISQSARLCCPHGIVFL